jgi:hypothetical protein
MSRIIIRKTRILAKKLAVDLILREQARFPSHIDIGSNEIAQVYKKCCQENILEIKNCLLKTQVTLDLEQTQKVTY